MRRPLMFFVMVMSLAQTVSSDEMVSGDRDGDLTTEEVFESYEVAARRSNSCHKNVTVNSKLKAKFAVTWASCAPGCASPSLEILPSASHCQQSTPSCHHTGNAADIRRVKCGATTYTGNTEAGIKKFSRIVSCFKGAGWKTFWQDDKHIVHFHVEPGDCTRKKGCCNSVACLD